MLRRFPSNLVCEVVYMEGIKYVNLVQICLVVMKIREAEIGDLAVRVNNTLRVPGVLAADTRLCVLILYII